MQLGLSSSPGAASSMRAVAPFGFRYQYLAGGVNTGSGWSNWNANGAFVTYYIQDSVANGITPVFSYYMIRQSNPGGGDEASAIANNLASVSTMRSFFEDLKLFFQRAGAFPSNRVVLHLEPDLWGFGHLRSTGDSASSVGAKVGSTGMSELAGLPDNLAGIAQAALRLRAQYAPNVTVAYHLSVWGTGNDILYSDPSNATVDALAARAAAFYRSLNASFDIAFVDTSDRDAAFKQYQYGDGGAAWWNDGDYARHARFLSGFSSGSGTRMVLWQTPLGNTRMRAQNNTWGHYQDNKVEKLLDDPARSKLTAYANAGVVAVLFGGGAAGTSCACDGVGDGVTNPAPINGNVTSSYNADDDGGFFKDRVAAYYAAGALSLPGGGATPSPTPSPTPTVPPVPTPIPTPSSTPSPTATPVPTPVPTPSPTATPSFTSNGSSSPAVVSRSARVTISIGVTSATTTDAIVDIEIYGPNGARVHQAFGQLSFTAGQPRTYITSYDVPSSGARGTYMVKVGLFSVGWGVLYDWNDRATTFRVR